MDLAAYRELDLENPGGWPLPAKLVAMVLILALTVAGGWYFDWQNQLASLERVRAQEAELRQEFETKQKRSANLEAYEAQLAQMQESFGAMLRQLPSRAEVARLLVDISQTGLASGLEFELFKPMNPVRREFYAELPVTIRVRGSYHEFARFISGAANLPRIVTLHDIDIAAGGEKAAAGELVMNLTAKTYWYLEEEDKQ